MLDFYFPNQFKKDLKLAAAVNMGRTGNIH
jgi:hypothetical protein